MADMVRWSLVVSRETDIALRTHLAKQGLRKGDLSRFVEDAVRWRVLDRTVSQVKNRNQSDRGEIGRAVEEALASVRSSRRSSRRR